MLELTPLSQLAVCGRDPDAVFGRGSGTVVSYRDWQCNVRRWSRTFRAVDGDDVALHFDDAIGLSAALWGAWHAGKVAWLPGDALPATLDALRIRVAAMAGTMPSALAAESEADDALSLALDPAHTRLYLFTSGSTGQPVAVEKRLQQLDAEVRALEACFGARLGACEVHGTVSPQHIYGLLFRVLWPVAAGRVITGERIEFPEQIAERLGSDDAVLVSTPAHLKRLPEAIDFSSARSALRAVFSSGGALPVEAAASAAGLLGKAPIEIYGSTETGGIAWREAVPEQSWQALPGVAWRVLEERLEIRSPHLPDSDWHRSEDRVRATGVGFDLLGRVDRILKVEERRVSLSAIERALLDSGWVADARALGVPGRRLLLGVAAVPTGAGWRVLVEEGKQALVHRLRQALLGRIDPTALPRRWRFVAAMPSDARGKSPEHLLAALFRPVYPEPNWLTREPDRAVLELPIGRDLRVFDGHFPQTPIVPGVALIGWALRFAREAFVVAGEPERQDLLKFQQVVRPGATLRLELDWKPAAGQLAFRYSAGEQQHASGRLQFASGQTS